MFLDLAASMVLLAAPQASASVPSDAASSRWILRHRPRDHDVEIGVFGGVAFPSPRLALRGRDGLAGEFDFLAPALGARIGYYPIRFFGLEGEAAFIPTRYSGDAALLYGGRAQGVIQAGWWRVVPFVLLGGGLVGVASRATVAGVDTDPAMHVGGGLKINATDRLVVRLDVRDVVAGGAPRQLSHSPEVLFTLAARFGAAPKPKPAPAPPDADGDGVGDPDDHCPKDAGVAENRGCPWGDRDCDGVDDGDDRCPQSAGAPPDGCTPPDADGDGIADVRDACPTEVGPEPDGCPDGDRDRDGIEGDADACPDEAETKNDFEDTDGCADELPEEVRRFTGVIAGITFATNTARVQPSSLPTLERAAEILGRHPDVELEIVGHTDDRGRPERNAELSRERAEAVKALLVQRGVAPKRLRTRGAGADEPRASNATAAGRAENRRIEFRLVE